MIKHSFHTVTGIEAAAILISTIIGVGVLALPRFAVEGANTGAPLVTILGILMAFIGLWLITRLGMRFPSQSIIEYSERIIGKWLARCGSVLIVLFFAVLTSLGAREFGEVVVTAVLPRTPVNVTTIVMLLLAAICTRTNMTTFAYAHLFYLPFLLGPALFILAFTTKNANFLNVQPLIGNEPSMMGMVMGALTVCALFQGSFIMTFVIPAMRSPSRAMTSSFWALIISGGMYLVTVVATLAVFGSEEIKLLLWPTLELAKTTMMPGEVLERLDAVFLALWVTAVFTTLYSTYSLTVRAIKDLFHLRDHSMLAFFILPFVFLIAMLPPNIVQLYRVIEIAGRVGMVLTVVYPLILLVVAKIRKQRDDIHANA
ncbi:GerAB/ArcD/ProY family transporter [Alicyclobacillus fastidiosus]|uniref:Endospore germination permease n=1 Tax=Alicyclobacillus fastidiosus TaxID=392011 RepID=A0ABV5AK11_9BACL|nr:endospore germination permease [Alicyclobacillus fastidiosus]WEH11026.1 endospore germination permease [Alicyclobacillus fastidiosus]